MACYHPIPALNRAPPGQKMDLVFNYRSSDLGQRVDLPCGKCVGCRLDYSRQWANRCMLELGYHQRACFLTLTYDDAHLPKTFSVDSETGEVLAPCATLRRRDPQLFLKRLRYFYPGSGVRFFGSGEYGTNTLRPHYHLILFGLDFQDKVVYSKGDKGSGFYYQSETLNKIWQNGQCLIAGVTWESCAYVARYALKKQKLGDKDVFKLVNIEPEFSMCSRKPGIGRQYYDDHPDLWKFQYINLPGGKKVPPPRYYKRLLSVDDPAKALQISEYNMYLNSCQKSLKEGLTDLDYYDILRVEEESKLKRILALRRDLI